MSTAETEIRRPQRWDTPYSEEMTDAMVDGVLALAPFRDMEPTKFPRTCSLRGIIRNDARLRTLERGDIVVREGDYGNSAFVLLQGSVEVLLESLPRKLLGRPQRKRKSIFQTAQQLFRPAPPEVRQYGKAELDQALGLRDDAGETRIFLQDVPGVLDQYNSLTLGAGEIFGELAAMARSPRTATIIANDSCMVLEIRWQGLRDLMRSDKYLKRRIDELYRQNSLEAHLRETTVLGRVSDEAIRIIANATTFESYGQFDWHGQYRKTSKQDVSDRIHAEPLISEEGDYIDGLILIRAGFARLSRRYGNGHRTLAYLGKGQSFGFEEHAYNWSTHEKVGLLNSLRAVGYVDTLRIPSRVVEEHILPTITTASIRRCTKAVRNERAIGEREVAFEEAADSDGLESGFLEFMLDQRLINGTKAMLINTDRCTRCDDCVRACASTHDQNPRFLRHGPQFANYMVANACMQCVDPVCMIGCPTGAISRDSISGNVLITDDTCIGCSTCANSCPYSNIRMVEIRSPDGAFLKDSETQQPLVKATKCDLCVDSWGGPACQRACPHDALVRIDMSHHESLLTWIRENP